MEFDNSWRAVFNPGLAGRYFDPAPGEPLTPRREYSIANARWLAELSRLAYRDDRLGEAPTRDRILAGVGLSESHFFHRRSTQCAIVEPCGDAPAPFAVLVFRGTDGPVDWGTNLKTTLTGWPPGGRVHVGFQRALDDVWPEVEAALGKLEVPLFYAGHSLGGALAMLAASRRPPLAVYTFGAPRAGDARFAETLSGIAAFFLMNRRDRVPSLPPRVPGLRYRHAGEARAISVGASGARLPPLPGRRRWFDPPGFVCDHAPVNYVACLERLARR